MNTDKIYAEAIANEYAPKETSKVKALKRLDRKAKSTANIFGYTFGVIMTLVLGTGMCLTMNVLGAWKPNNIYYRHCWKLVSSFVLTFHFYLS